MKKVLVAVAVVVLVMGVTYVYAHGPWQGSRYGAGPMGGQDWGPGEGFSLTPEQRTQLQEMRRKFFDETTQLRQSILAKREEVRALYADPKVDSDTIVKKEGELRDLQDQMRDKAVQLRLEARKVLTPEQLAQFGGRMGMGPGYGRGYGHGYGRGYHSGRGPGYGPCH
jgi:Spy/CpxP family protein refolding chaperone